MVPPAHGADLEDAEAAWSKRLGFLLGLNTEAVVIQLVAPDDALAPALIQLLLAQTPSRPLRVAFDVAGLYDAPEGAVVVLVAPERSARALNLHRPVVRTRRMQLLLWCTPEGAFELKGSAPDMNSWISHRLHLPPAWPPRVAEALLGARDRGEALSLLGPASPPPGFTPVQASLDPAPLADALDAGPVWLTGAQDALDVFTALAIWAERGKHGLVLHDPAVVADAVPRLDAAPVPWTEAAEVCVAMQDAATEPGVLAATLGLDPAALGLAGIERQRVESTRFVGMLARLRAGERPIGDAEMLSLSALSARWRKARRGKRGRPSPRTPSEIEVARLTHAADAMRVAGALTEALRVRREEVLPRLERLGDVRARALNQRAVAALHIQRGSLDSAFALLKTDVLPTFERLGDAPERANTLNKLVDVMMRRGTLEDARQLLEDTVLPTSLAMGDRLGHAHALSRLAQIRGALGDDAEAARILSEEVLPALEELGDARDRALARAQLAQCLSKLGRTEEAILLLRGRVLPELERLKARTDLPPARLIFAVALLHRGAPGDHEEARAVLLQVHKDAQTLGLGADANGLDVADDRA